jgi:hypothetical protein
LTIHDSDAAETIVRRGRSARPERVPLAAPQPERVA